MAREAVGPAEEHPLGEGRVRDELYIDVENPALLVGGANVDHEGPIIGELALVHGILEMDRDDGLRQAQNRVEEINEERRALLTPEQPFEREVGQWIDDSRRLGMRIHHQGIVQVRRRGDNEQWARLTAFARRYHAVPAHSASVVLSSSSKKRSLTESQIMHDPTTSLHALARLRELGVQLDMDDFGTGHSSLACLLQFPIHILKIDRSVIASMCSGRDAMALVEAVIRLAKNLQIRVIAEGIETIEQLDIPWGLDCTFGQGYLLSRPLDASRLLEFRLSDQCGSVIERRAESLDSRDHPLSLL